MSEVYIVRTTPSKEIKFLNQIYDYLSKKENHGVLSAFSPESVKGYIFVETTSLKGLIDVLRGVPNNKGVIRTPVSFEEINKCSDKEGEKVVVNERDVVEVIAGPFKGDKARVIRLVPGKDEVVIEPINTPVPIPITLNLDDLRIINKEGEE